jgi:hypothetical protein
VRGSKIPEIWQGHQPVELLALVQYATINRHRRHAYIPVMQIDVSTGVRVAVADDRRCLDLCPPEGASPFDRIPLQDRDAENGVDPINVLQKEP